jgi:hypothetical protein
VVGGVFRKKIKIYPPRLRPAFFEEMLKPLEKDFIPVTGVHDQGDFYFFTFQILVSISIIGSISICRRRSNLKFPAQFHRARQTGSM